ncbi:hypothetical protein MKEN_00210400 [Mycena kentingensis (nom. inval.)]|nr:hypothetical protein MKEN_00210400 [Mycena kentingensis (nom. inval.)]
MSSTTINYAELYGIHSVGAAAVFLTFYLPLTGWFVFQSVKRTAAVYILMVILCSMRTGAFLIRALMAKPGSAASTSMTASIANQVLLNAGFFALLYGAFGLVLDRHIMAGGKRYPITTLNPLCNKLFFHILVNGTVIVGLVGSVRNIRSANDPDSEEAVRARKLRKISTLLLVLFTALQLMQSILFFRQPRRAEGAAPSASHPRRPVADRQGRILLIIISTLLLIRELFLLATIDNAAKANQESLWYPFVSLTELLVVLMFALPGLVPARAELLAAEREREAAAQRGETPECGKTEYV